MAMSRSPSPSPILRSGMGGTRGKAGKRESEKDHEDVIAELAKNGMDHVTIDGGVQLRGGSVREEDVRAFFDGFAVDKVRGCNLEFL